MKFSPADLSELLGTYLEPGVEVVRTASMSGGCINQALQLELSNGERLFAKVNSPELTGMFEAEAKGLAALDKPGGPRIPHPIAAFTGVDYQLLVTTFIDRGRPSANYWETAGRQLASLHSADVGVRYGFDEDNYIGATPQPNDWSGNWVEFFAEQRLGFQIRMAEKRGLANRSLTRDVHSLIERLEEFLPDTPHPAVLHGDLWSGNIMADSNGEPVIFDPAVSIGHFEADLAMTELFGRFDQRFYDAYGEVTPIPSEYFDARCGIYKLYHVLNHLNLFGSGYASQAAGLVKRLV